MRVLVWYRNVIAVRVVFAALLVQHTLLFELRQIIKRELLGCETRAMGILQ